MAALPAASFWYMRRTFFLLVNSCSCAAEPRKGDAGFFEETSMSLSA